MVDSKNKTMHPVWEIMLIISDHMRNACSLGSWLASWLLDLWEYTVISAPGHKFCVITSGSHLVPVTQRQKTHTRPSFPKKSECHISAPFEHEVAVQSVQIKT